MKKKNIIFCILTLIFFTNCVSYNNKPIDTTKIENGNNQKISYTIYDPSIEGRDEIKKSFINVSTQFNYNARNYDINNEMYADNETNNKKNYERFYKIAKPELIYSEEETYVVIYCGTKYSELKSFYNTFSSCTLRLIPFINNEDIQFVIDVFKSQKFKKRYTYILNVDIYLQTFLLPALYFDPIDKKSQNALDILFQQFFLDCQKDKLL